MSQAALLTKTVAVVLVVAVMNDDDCVVVAFLDVVTCEDAAALAR